jgi:UDP-N-acetylglucosamine:LPS N-acetylglucosamine transferase
MFVTWQRRRRHTQQAALALESALLVVFGGSSGSGLLNDTWLWDVTTSTWTEVSWGAV